MRGLVRGSRLWSGGVRIGVQASYLVDYGTITDGPGSASVL
jgi:hypothetical protein